MVTRSVVDPNAVRAVLVARRLVDLLRERPVSEGCMVPDGHWLDAGLTPAELDELRAHGSALFNRSLWPPPELSPFLTSMFDELGPISREG